MRGPQILHRSAHPLQQRADRIGRSVGGDEGAEHVIT